jgi:two-component system chemotaxis sensor kinase CheA
MSFDLDDDILQDFLIESGEILDLLSEQLVLLEKQPDNTELLNAIFRGFHTIKGGAGFLTFTPLVDVCHLAENIFDQLRTHRLSITQGLMDGILTALDCVESMFQSIQNKEPLSAPPESLLNCLKAIAAGDVLDEKKPADSTPNVNSPSSLENDMSDGEFDYLLDELHGIEALSDVLPESTPSLTLPDEAMKDEEFEQLLDELHGKGKGPSGSIESNDTPKIKSDLPPIVGLNDTPLLRDPEVSSAPPILEKQTKNHSVTESSVRVDTRTLDIIMNMVGELVLVRNRLVSLGLDSADEELSKAVGNLDIVTGDLQGAVMKTRMQPIKKVFGRFPRIIRDLSRSLNKEIELIVHGEETDLDKNLVEALADPLIHLVRNAIDHGIELPETRKAAGKNPTGQVLLSAAQEGDHILLTIEDDGRGMDPEILKNIAIQRGVLDTESAARLSDRDAYHLVFAPGFSTKTEISDISGRGVGMDVVKTAINQLNGNIEIDSVLGRGSVISITVPLTLAILPALMIGVGDQPFALPLSSVSEIFHLDLRESHVVEGQSTVKVRDKALPLFYLQDWLSQKPVVCHLDFGHVVIVQVGHIRVGLVVDVLIGQEEVVIKPLDCLLQGTPGMAGATITSDGHIALILDVPNLLNYYAH